MKRISHLPCIAALFPASGIAAAQNIADAPPGAAVDVKPTSGYTGPSGAPMMTAKDLLAKGKDDQYVRLKGKLTSHKGDEDYEFTDASGRTTAEIDPDRFPQGVKADHNTVVELAGEFDKEMFGESKLDVEQIKVVAQ